MIAQRVVHIRNQDIKDQTAIERLGIGFALGAMFSKSIDDYCSSSRRITDAINR